MWKTACYLTGGLFAALASVCVWAASIARLEEAGDLERFEFNALLIGGMFALALILFSAPRMVGAARWRYALLVTGVVMIWGVVSGRLIWLHEEHFRSNMMEVRDR